MFLWKGQPQSNVIFTFCSLSTCDRRENSVKSHPAVTTLNCLLLWRWHLLQLPCGPAGLWSVTLTTNHRHRCIFCLVLWYLNHFRWVWAHPCLLIFTCIRHSCTLASSCVYDNKHGCAHTLRKIFKYQRLKQNIDLWLVVRLTDQQSCCQIHMAIAANVIFITANIAGCDITEFSFLSHVNIL